MVESFGSKVLTITSTQQLNYCPACGEETEREEFQVGTYKTNVEIRCPKHGTLILG